MSDTDPFNLHRFVDAQQHTYATALSEIRAGRKRSHWMWFVFPQFRGLGPSARSVHFAITSVAEAAAYLAHPVLGTRLREIFTALVNIDGRSAAEIFGSPDDMKLRSSATLFARVAEPGSVFDAVLQKYFGGKPDESTLRLLGSEAGKM